MTTGDRASRVAEIEMTIAGNKLLLSQSDYKAIKYAEGVLSAEDFEEAREARQALRDEINELEEELASIVEE